MTPEAFPVPQHRRNPNPPLRSLRFDHENLDVYQESLAFIVWLEPFLQKLSNALAVRDQLDRASTSVVLNLAEGNGKNTARDRCRYFDNSRASALECAAALDVAAAKCLCELPVAEQGKERLRRIVSMLVGLIRANSDYSLRNANLD
jgi:four helix bundle protein